MKENIDIWTLWKMVRSKVHASELTLEIRAGKYDTIVVTATLDPGKKAANRPGFDPRRWVAQLVVRPEDFASIKGNAEALGDEAAWKLNQLIRQKFPNVVEEFSGFSDTIG